MTYIRLTGPPQKVRMAALGGGTCPRFPGPGMVLEGLRGQFDLIHVAAHPRSRRSPEQNEGGYRRIRHSRIDRISLLDIGPRHRSSAAYPTKISAVLPAPRQWSAKPWWPTAAASVTIAYVQSWLATTASATRRRSARR